MAVEGAKLVNEAPPTLKQYLSVKQEIADCREALDRADRHFAETYNRLKTYPVEPEDSLTAQLCWELLDLAKQQADEQRTLLTRLLLLVDEVAQVKRRPRPRKQ